GSEAGETGTEAVDFGEATDVEAWGTEVVAYNRDDFDELDPRTLVNFLQRYTDTEVEFDGQKVRMSDFFDITRLNDTIIRLEADLVGLTMILRSKYSLAGQQITDPLVEMFATQEEQAKWKGLKKSLEDIRKSWRVEGPQTRVSYDEITRDVLRRLKIREVINRGDGTFDLREATQALPYKQEMGTAFTTIQVMGSVEFTIYRIRAYRAVAEYCNKINSQEARQQAEYYTKQADFYENEIDKLIIFFNGRPGYAYGTLANTQKADDKDDKTPETNIIAAAPTIVRVLPDQMKLPEIRNKVRLNLGVQPVKPQVFNRQQASPIARIYGLESLLEPLVKPKPPRVKYQTIAFGARLY
ncbi:MAG: hypothetical protein AAB267_10075, partial [Candidatus Desantisbacteria bacterium]